MNGHEAYIGDEVGPISNVLEIPAVFTLHGLYNYHLQGFGEKTMYAIIRNLRQVRNLIAVSSIAAQSYQVNGLGQISFEIIPNGITLPKDDDVRKREDILDFSKGRIILLTVGFLVPEKRIDLVIKSLTRLKNKDVVLVIVGKGFLEKKLKILAAEERCQDRILFLGAIPPANMNSVYASADILIHPSIIDSFSMVCLEAMSNNLPVICTTNIGILEFVTNRKDILAIKPDSLVELTETIQSLISNPALREEIGHNARKVAEQLTWEKQVQRIATMYERILSR